MFSKKIKNFLLILISLSFICTTSFAVDKDVANEGVLVQNVQKAKTRNQREKALKNLFYYYINVDDWNNIINVSNDLLRYKLSKKEKYIVYYNSARAYRKNKKFEDAITAAQEAEYLYPKNIDVKMLMGEVYRDNSLYELAASKFKNVLDLDDKHVTALINLGSIYKAQENYKAALEYYTKAIRLRENLSKEVYINTAISYKETGDLDNALGMLKNVKGKDRDASLITADIYYMKHDIDKAKKALQPYVYGQKLDLEIYCKLAEFCILSKDYNETVKLMSFYKSKSKKKNAEIVDYMLAEAYYMSGDKKKSLKILNDILKYTKSDYFKDIVKKLVTFEKARR